MMTMPPSTSMLSQRRVDHDGPQDVGGDQELEPDQDAAPEIGAILAVVRLEAVVPDAHEKNGGRDGDTEKDDGEAQRIEDMARQAGEALACRFSSIGARPGAAGAASYPHLVSHHWFCNERRARHKAKARRGRALRGGALALFYVSKVIGYCLQPSALLLIVCSPRPSLLCG